MRRISAFNVISSTSTKDGRVLRFSRRPRVAGARRHLERAELHGFVQRNIERDDAAGNLVETREGRGRIGDALAFRRLGHRLRRRCWRRQIFLLLGLCLGLFFLFVFGRVCCGARISAAVAAGAAAVAAAIAVAAEAARGSAPAGCRPADAAAGTGRRQCRDERQRTELPAAIKRGNFGSFGNCRRRRGQEVEPIQ